MTAKRLNLLDDGTGPGNRTPTSSLRKLTETISPAALLSGVSAILIVLFPYIATLASAVKHELTGIPNYDSFAYLWVGEVNIYFFTGRSLAQRIIFYLLSNSPDRIFLFQHLFMALTSLVWLLALSKPSDKLAHILTACVVAWVSSSRYIQYQSLFLSAEPIYIASLLLFPAAVIAARKLGGKTFPWIVVPVGLFAILSKNTGPLYVAGIMLFHLFYCWIKQGRRKIKYCLIATIILIGAAAARFLVTLRYDTSMHINAANNYFSRVFIDENRIEYFVHQHGMPTGPFIESCAGGSILTPGFNGEPILDVDYEVTRNYLLLDDEYGFSSWVRERGTTAWTRYLLANTSTFIGEFLHDYRRYKEQRNMLDLNFLFIGCPPSDSKARLQQFFAEHVDFRNARTDPLQIVQRIYLRCPFNDSRTVVLIVLAGLLLLCVMPAGKASDRLELAVMISLASIFLAYISYFGDGMEHERHLAPPYVLYLAGMLAMAGSILAILFSVPAGRFKRQLNTGRED